MEVVCHFQSPATGLTSPICSYFVPNDFTSQNIIELFPFEGCDFFFRIKISSSALGIPNPSNDFVWLDVTPDLDRSVNWSKANEYFPSGRIDVKVVAVDVEFDDEITGLGEQELSQYLDESRVFLPEDARQPRPAISVKEATAPSGSQASLASVASSAASFVSSFIPQSSKSDAASSASTTSTAPVINLKSVQKGASNLWNVLKSTTEKIQSQGIGGIFNVEANPTISKKAYTNLTTLSQLMSSTYQDKNPQHGYIIMKLWETTFPNDVIPSSTGLIAESPLWKSCGWQKEHPSHDLKISGLLALNSLTYFGEVYREISQQMIKENRENTKQNYPYAIVGVNLTLLLADLFAVKDNEFLSKQAGYWTLFDEPEAFYEIFSLSFMHIDILWRQKQAVRSQFGAIIGETKSLLTRILTRQPTSLLMFKDIGAEEGMLFKN